LKNKHAVELGRLGGQSTTQAKAEASKKNGAMGGRPRKSRGALVITEQDRNRFVRALEVLLSKLR